ncbi:MAG TPA: response regulator [Pseudolabrys sp.]|nr:response regulator [Pseudolabrys sp.]
MHQTISMLIADDSHIIQEIFVEAARLSKLPLRLTATDNGRDCLTMLSGGNVDLALIDVNMPELRHRGLLGGKASGRTNICHLVTCHRTFIQ